MIPAEVTELIELCGILAELLSKQMPVRKKYLNFVIRRINELTAIYLAG